MPIVARIDGVKIVFHFNDHGRPHFHAVTSDHRVTIELETLEVTKGYLPRAKHEIIKKWAQSRRALLLEAWQACRSGETPERIR